MDDKSKKMAKSEEKTAADEIEIKLQEMFDGIEDPKINGTPKTAVKENTPKQVKKAHHKKFKAKNKKIQKKVLKAMVPTNNDTFIKFKGPYIQVRSNKPVVINFPVNEEEPEKLQTKQKQIKKHSQNKSATRKLCGMHASTLSAKYDDQTTDQSWICVFCKKGPHKNKLGDLYGPYILNDEGKGKAADSPSVKKMQNKKQLQDINPLVVNPEIWTHESCAVMTCGIYIIGNKIIGLDEAAVESQSQICSYCELSGATIECLQRNCDSLSHFICAKQKNWSLSKDFQYFCNAHISNKAV